MNPKDDIVAIIKNLKDRLEIMERGVAGVSIPPAMPAGTVIPYAGSSAPTGYLICDGSAISRSTYSALYAIIGTTYGAGDGSTTFNLPNLKGKTIVGYNSAETEFDVLGETGGAKTHTLTTDEIPSHTHKTGIQESLAGNYVAGSASAYVLFDQTSGLNTTATGGGLAHNNLQPYITLKYIIKT